MRDIVCTACVAAILAAGGVLIQRAEAFTPPTPSAFSAAAASGDRIRQVVNVCGSNGCAPVQTKRVQHQKPGAVAAKHI